MVPQGLAAQLSGYVAQRADSRCIRSGCPHRRTPWCSSRSCPTSPTWSSARGPPRAAGLAAASQGVARQLWGYRALSEGSWGAGLGLGAGSQGWEPQCGVEVLMGKMGTLFPPGFRVLSALSTCIPGTWHSLKMFNRACSRLGGEGRRLLLEEEWEKVQGPVQVLTSTSVPRPCLSARWLSLWLGGGQHVL